MNVCKNLCKNVCKPPKHTVIVNPKRDDAKQYFLYNKK